MRIFGSERVKNMVNALGLEEDQPIEAKMLTNAIENAQKKVEERNFNIRKRLLEYDDVLNNERNFIYAQRDEIQQRWLQQAAQTAHDDFPAFSRACLEEEAAFYRKWSNCVLSPVSCGAGFRKRWTKKNQVLFSE